MISICRDNQTLFTKNLFIMKHIFFLLLLSSTIAHLAAQQNEPIKANINTDYLKKSKKQKTVAFI